MAIWQDIETVIAIEGGRFEYRPHGFDNWKMHPQPNGVIKKIILNRPQSAYDNAAQVIKIISFEKASSGCDVVH